MRRINADNDAYKASSTSRMKAKGKETTVEYDKFFSPVVNTNNIKKAPVRKATFNAPGDYGGSK